MTQLTLGAFSVGGIMLEFSHVSPQDDCNLNPRFPVVAGRVDMQLVGCLYWLVLWLKFIPEMGAHRFARHESLSILRSEGASVCVEIFRYAHVHTRREALYMAGLPPKSWHPI